MKSFESVYQRSPLSLVAPPFAFFDDTKVQHRMPVVKNKKTILLRQRFSTELLKKYLFGGKQFTLILI
jgi:hypothetical protein